MSGTPANDWTLGPAKWAAVSVLGVAAIGGLVWSNTGRTGRIPAAAPSLAVTSTGAPTAAIAAAEEKTERTAQGPLAAERAIPAATVLDLNTATVAQLELLPGIGPALARRIVEHRERQGPFKSAEGLNAVRGIGPKTIERLLPLVRVGRAEPAEPAAPR